jgi:SAM-dependent methyltransferase
MPAIQSSEEAVFSPRAPGRGVPLLRAALAQTAAGLLIAGYTHFIGQPPFHPLVVQGIVAGAAGQALRLPLWWLPINITFVPAAAAAQTLHISPLWFLAAFAGLLIVFWDTFRTRVPLYLSSARACTRLAQMLPADATARILDLGCGFGGVMLALRRLRPAVRLVGLELAPLPAWLARLRLRRDANSTVRRRDFWDEDFSDYDVVYAFLSPEPMEQLWAKARAQMRPGSLFISNSFGVPGVPPDLTLPLKSSSGRALYVWRIRS